MCVVERGVPEKRDSESGEKRVHETGLVTWEEGASGVAGARGALKGEAELAASNGFKYESIHFFT